MDKTPDQMVDEASKRLEKRRKEEEKQEAQKVEELRSGYMRRTGRKDLKP